jgi:hypothetical protein
MICISPIAPVYDVIREPSASSNRPPDSWRITARIQVSGTPKRLAASVM